MLCNNDCGFYAYSDNDGYCSKCKPILKSTEDIKAKIEHEEKSDLPSKSFGNINLCLVCNKKVKIFAVQCKCKQPLCKLHVSETSHTCAYDYKKHGKELLNITNPKIIAEKINHL